MGPSPWTSTCNPGGVATLQCFEDIFRNILQSIIPLAGLAAFVLLLMGGFKYLSSAGDPKKVQEATGMITGTIIGIAVAVGVWFIFKLIEAVTGINVLQFTVPS